jgi:hypothetical protein
LLLHPVVWGAVVGYNTYYSLTLPVVWGAVIVAPKYILKHFKFLYLKKIINSGYPLLRLFLVGTMYY